MATVTIRDVAKRAEVGVGTVSRVINNSPNVRAKTRERVEIAIKELGWHSNSIARQLSSGRTMQIGTIVPTFTRPSFVERLRGVVQVFSKTEYDLTLFSVETPEQRDRYFKKPLGDRVDGIVFISLPPKDDEAKRLAKAKTPVVLIDGFHPAMNSIYIDDVLGGQQATQHLINLGHQKIAYLSDHIEASESWDIIIGNSAMRHRYVGYRRALENAKLAFNPAWHVQVMHGREEAKVAALELLDGVDRPKAIFAASDTQAIGVIQAAQELNLSIPDDLSIIGFDDIEVAQYMNLTTIRQPLYRSGADGAQLLLNVLQNNTPSQPQQYKLPTELMIRKTTAPAH